MAQGWGPQRHSNGESTSRAICMLPILTGMIGKPGTNTGMREAEAGGLVGSIPAGKNPVEVAINCYQWLNAVDHGATMTAARDGVRGADALSSGIKFIWNYGGNCITNQHSDINLVHDILQDESKLEFLVVVDTVMADSAKYADILLPDAMRAEQFHMANNGYAEYYLGVLVGEKGDYTRIEGLETAMERTRIGYIKLREKSRISWKACGLGRGGSFHTSGVYKSGVVRTSLQISGDNTEGFILTYMMGENLSGDRGVGAGYETEKKLCSN